MPPASSGWHILRFIRHSSITPRKKAIQKRKAVKHKSSPGEGPQKITRQANDPSKPANQPSHTPANLPSYGSSSFFARTFGRIPQSYRQFIGTTLIFTPFALLAGLHFPAAVMSINGGSMAPFFNPNASPDLPETKDWVLVQYFPEHPRASAKNEAGAIPGTDLRRGQIIVFKTPHDPNKIAVKRIVGIPGDRVQPLPGYPGGEEKVVVQYNHLWVEGDVDDREKSMDSNWYGPISQPLVVGKVVALLGPWLGPTWINIEEHEWHARAKGRVEEDVVRQATMDHDEVEKERAFADGRVARDTEMMTSNVEAVAELIRVDEGQRSRAIEYYKRVRKELHNNNPETVEVAKNLVEALEDVMVMAGFDKQNLRESVRTPEQEKDELKRETELEDPFIQVGSLPKRDLPENIVEEGPAARALRERLEKNRKERMEGVDNGLDDSERQMMWKEQDRIMRENAERIQAESARKRAEASNV